ncbi:hypothetical protein ACFLS9_09170 [Bacteroidota bacterium]
MNYQTKLKGYEVAKIKCGFIECPECGEWSEIDGSEFPELAVYCCGCDYDFMNESDEIYHYCLDRLIIQAEETKIFFMDVSHEQNRAAG